MNDDVMAAYADTLQLLQRGADENLANIFIAYGIIQVFCRQFDLAQKVFQACLLTDGNYMAACGTEREIIMDAYEAYAFVDEDVWLSMLRDRRGMPEKEKCPAVIARILDVYVPAFRLLQNESRQILGRAENKI